MKEISKQNVTNKAIFNLHLQLFEQNPFTSHAKNVDDVKQILFSAYSIQKRQKRCLRSAIFCFS